MVKFSTVKMYADVARFNSSPFVPVPCCGLENKDVLVYAACGTYKFEAPHFYNRVGPGSIS